jgi:hypothetical protein
VHDGEVRQERIAGDPGRELNPLGETLARLNQIMREAECLALLVGKHMPGQHHVDHARNADQPRYAH